MTNREPEQRYFCHSCKEAESLLIYQQLSVYYVLTVGEGVKAKKQAELDRLMKDVLAASAKLNEAAQPKPHRFQIAPAK